MPRSAARRTVLAWSAASLAAVAALGAAAALAAPLAARRAVIALCRERLGIEVSVERVGGFVLRGVEIRGIRALGPASAGPLVGLEVGRLRAAYRAGDILRGLDALLAGASLEVDGLAVRLDLDRPGRPPAAGAPPPSLPAVLPRILLDSGRVDASWRGAEAALGGVSLGVEAVGEGRYAIRLGIRQAAVEHPRFKVGPGPLDAAAEYGGGVLTIARAGLGSAVVEGARVDLGRLPAEADAEIPVTLPGGRVLLRLRRSGGATGIAWSTDGLDVAGAADALPAGLQPGRPDAAGAISTRGSLRLPDGRAELLEGSAEALWTDGRVNGVSFGRAALLARAGEGRLVVDRLELSAGSNALALEGLQAPLDVLLGGDRQRLLAHSAGRVSVDLGDIPALAALAGMRWSPGIATPPHRLTAGGEIRDGRLALGRSALRARGLAVEIEGAELAAPPDGSGWADAPVALRAKVSIPDLSALAAIVPLPAMVGSLFADAAVGGSLAAPEGSLRVAGAGIAVGGYKVGTVRLEAEGARSAVQVRRLELRPGSRNLLQLREIAFDPAALFDDDRTRVLDGLRGRIDLDARDLTALLAAAGIAFPAGGQAPPQHLAASGVLEGRGARFDEAVLRSGSSTIRLRGSSVRLPRGARAWQDVAFETALEVTVPDLSDVAGLLGAPGLAGTLRVDGRLRGTARSPGGSLSVDVEIADAAALAPLLPADEPPSGPLRLRASAEGGAASAAGRFLVELGRGSWREVPFAGARVAGRFEASDATGVRVDLEEVGIEAFGTGLASSRPALLEWGGGRLRVTALELRGPNGALSLEGGTLPGCVISASLGLAGLSSGSWLAAAGIAGVTFEGGMLEASFSGSCDAPVASVRAAVPKMDVAGLGRGSADLRGDYRPGMLRLARIAAVFKGGPVLELAGEVPLDLSHPARLPAGRLRLEGTLSVPDLDAFGVLLPAAARFSGRLEAALAISGSWAEPSGSLRVRGFLSPPPGTGLPLPPSPLALDADLLLSREALRVDRLAAESPELSVSGLGSYRPGVPWIRLAQVEGGLSAGRIEARLAFTARRLGWATAAVEGLRRVEGRVEGEVSASGSLGDPRVEGVLVVRDGSLRFGDAPGIEDLQARATLAGRTVVVERLAGEYGGSPFAVDGRVRFPAAGDPLVDLRLSGTNLILFRDRRTSVRGDVALAATGPYSRLSVGGAVTITGGGLVYNVFLKDLLEIPRRPAPGETLVPLRFRDPPLRDLRLDVRVGAREPFPIRGNLARIAVRPDLVLSGTGQRPVLTGTVHVEPGRLSLPGGPLAVQAGRVEFVAASPDRPRLDIPASARMLGYDIAVRLTGPLDEPEVVLSSAPPLPREELLLLLLTGTPPASAGTDALRAAAGTRVAVFVARNFLEKVFGEGFVEAEEIVLERFEMDYGRTVTESGGATIDTRFRLTGDLAGTGGALYLTSQKDAYDDYNVGLRLLFRFP